MNVLIVEPEAVLPLINGSLRMPHKEALKYVKLRQDFASARVEGRSLQQLLTDVDSSGGVASPGVGRRGGSGGVASPGGGRREG